MPLNSCTIPWNEVFYYFAKGVLLVFAMSFGFLACHFFGAGRLRMLLFRSKSPLHWSDPVASHKYDLIQYFIDSLSLQWKQNEF